MNRAAIIAVAAGVLLPLPLHAQAPWVAPSISVGLAYDDNVLATDGDEQDDMMLRVTPTLEAGFRSARGEWRFLHSFDGEKYRDNTQLDDAMIRRYTELDFDYRVTPRLDAALVATTAASDIASDLLPEFGLEHGRTESRRTTVEPELAYRFTRRTSGTAGIEVGRDDLAGGTTADTRGGYLGVAHATTPRSTWHIQAIRREFSFRPGGDAHSNILLLGWEGQVTPRTTLSAFVGPRQTEVDTQPEVLLGMQHTIQGGHFSAGYERSERTLIGLSALAETNVFWAVYAYPLTPALTLRAIPTFASLTRGDRESDTSHFALEAEYRFTPMISMVSRYQWNKQTGSLQQEGPSEFTRNVVFFGMTVAFSPRGGQTPPAEIRRRSR